MRTKCEFYMIARASRSNEPEKGLQEFPYCRKIQKALDVFDYCKLCKKKDLTYTGVRYWEEVVKRST